MRQFMLMLIIFFLLLGGKPSSSWASDGSALAAAQCEYGVQSINAGNPSAAIEHFVKAVLLDTSNQQAKEYLRSAFSDEKTGSLRDRLVLQRMVDLIDYIDFLKGRLSFLDRSNQQFMAMIAVKASQGSPTYLSFASIQKDLEKNQNLLSGEFNGISPDEVDQPLDVEKIVVKLASAREKLLTQVNYLQSINTQLYNLKINLAQELAARSSEQSSVSALTAELTHKDAIVEKQSQTLSQLNQVLKSFRAEMDDVQLKLNNTNQKLAQVTKQLAQITLEDYEKDKRLADKENQLETLTSQLNESNARLNLVQKLIQEKEQEIADLQNVKTLAQASAPVSTQKIEQLEALLADLNSKYTALATKLEQKDQQLIDLKLLSTEKDQRLADLRTAFLSKDQKVAELNDMLTLYRWKLNVVSSSLKQREEKVDQLEKLLDGVDQKMGQRLSKITPDNTSSGSKDQTTMTPRVSPKPIDVDYSLWSKKEMLQDLQRQLNFN